MLKTAITCCIWPASPDESPLFPSKCRLNNPKYFFLGLCCLSFANAIQGQQCPNYIQLFHTDGSLNIGCTTVEVTPVGAAISNGPFCGGIGPYQIGIQGTSGGFDFHFSPPVSAVKVEALSIDNHPTTPPIFSTIEEVIFNINGAFYPLTNPGSGNVFCQLPAVVSPTGTLMAPPGAASQGWGEARELVFTMPINSIRITDNIIAGTPLGVSVSVYVCCQCTTDAGQIISSPVYACWPNPASVPAATQTNLDNGDLLQYILFSNQANPTGSILATSNTPNFAFNPATMLAGTTYYVASIAGNNLNGNVDFADACLDLSNFIAVIWQNPPAVTFSISTPNVCGGGCATITANFTGTPPFTLNYSNPLTGAGTASFSGNTGTFNICPPANAPNGPFVISATSLSDAHCSCQ